MNAEDIAKKIDEMTMAELEAQARTEQRYTGMPTAGADCDSVQGWCKRLGYNRAGRLTQDLLPWLISKGLAEELDGYVMRRTGPYPCKLIRSKVLEKKAAER